MYSYHVVQIPQVLQVSAKEQDTALAALMQRLIEQNAAQGWEFYRVDTLSVAVAPGCLAALFGARQTFTPYSVVTFRRPR